MGGETPCLAENKWVCLFTFKNVSIVNVKETERCYFGWFLLEIFHLDYSTFWPLDKLGKLDKLPHQEIAENFIITDHKNLSFFSFTHLKRNIYYSILYYIKWKSHIFGMKHRYLKS